MWFIRNKETLKGDAIMDEQRFNTNYNNINGQQTGYTAQNYRPVYAAPPTLQSQPASAPKKKKTFMPKVLVALAIGLIFGISASLGFYATNTLTGYKDTKDSSKEVSELKEEVNELKGLISSMDDGSVVITDASSGVQYSTVVTDVTEVVEKVMPSMVSITNLYEETYSYWGRVYTEELEASGSGIIVGENDTEYLLVTNYHVIEGNVQLTVQFVDEATATAYVKGSDESIDIAVLGVKKSDLDADTKKAIAIAKMGDSDNLKIGEPAIAIGNALGYGQSVTTGVISALNRDIQMENTWNSLIQTNAAINPGNSGGALLNIQGEVIGINSNKIGGSTVEGMGYAIPISDVKEVIEAFMNRTNNGKVSNDERGYLGINGSTVDDTTSATFGIPKGVYVTSVYVGSAADEAGILKGDVITNVDGQNIKEISELQELLEYHKNGDTITVKLMRSEPDGYKEIVMDVTLGTK